MGFFDLFRSEKRASPESINSSATAAEIFAFFGIDGVSLPSVTVDTALTVPAVQAAVNFLPASLANLPLHAYRATGKKTEKLGGALQRLLNEAPNPEWSSFAARKYFWTQLFTHGRGLFWIERGNRDPIALWPMDPTKTTVKRVGLSKIYEWKDGNANRAYSAADVIDVPFLLKSDQLSTYSPITNGAKAIQLALAMNDYGSQFFAGGGVPPLALVGPMPAGPEAMKRAMADISRAIDAARASDKPIVNIPPGYELKPIGIDPDKGQMTDARRFQVEEIARVFNLPPAFLQDLTHGTFSNVEMQDIQLVKHSISHWAKALEDELNLKLFGAENNRRFVEHSMDGLMRGVFKDRIEGLARGVQSALITPNEARDLENRPPLDGGDDLMIQGATLPLKDAGKQPPPQPDAGNGDAIDG